MRKNTQRKKWKNRKGKLIRKTKEKIKRMRIDRKASGKTKTYM